MSESAIRAEHLQKSFRDLPVLKDVSIEVARASVFALLGSNGAGKTTLIKILTTLLPFDGGTAVVSGADVPTASHAERGARDCAEPAGDVDRQLDPRASGGQTGRQRNLDRAGLVHRNSDRRVYICRTCVSETRIKREKDRRNTKRPDWVSLYFVRPRGL